MQNVRVALAQMAPKLGDLGANLENHLSQIADADRRGADVVVFPELSLTGYLLQDQVPEVSLIVELDPEVLRRARTAYPMLADENLDLVSRELERIRRLRYDLPEIPAPATTDDHDGGRR